MAINSVGTNLSALFTQNQLVSNQRAIDQTSQQLSSGLRINSAADDAAGLSIATRINSETLGITQSIRNANDGVSLLQTAEGALAQSSDILMRMRELTLQSANGIYTASDRASIDKEYGQLLEQLGQIQERTTFNGRQVLGEDAEALQLQIGEQAGDTLTLSNGFDLGSLQSADVNDPAARLAAIDSAIDAVNSNRGDIGASMNRLDSTVSNLNQNLVSSTETLSRIMDTDYAAASSVRAQQQIQEQVGIAMLAQANAQQSQVLRLLQFN